MEFLSPSIILHNLELVIQGQPPDIPIEILCAHVHRYFAVAFALGHKVEPTGDDSALSLEMLYDLEDPRGPRD